MGGQWLENNPPPQSPSGFPASEIFEIHPAKSAVPPTPPPSVPTLPSSVSAPTADKLPVQEDKTAGQKLSVTTALPPTLAAASPEKKTRHRRSHSEGVGNAFSFSIRPPQQLATKTAVESTQVKSLVSPRLAPPPPPPSRGRK